MNPWDERYSQDGYFYGTQPNDFLVSQFQKINPGGKVLCLADGEGRNSVFLAEKGYQVLAVDMSPVGLAKGSMLATERGVEIDTLCQDLAGFDMGDSQWDAVVSISAHTPTPVRRALHEQLSRALAPGGVLILEAYTPEQLYMPGIGGPPPSAIDFFMPLDTLREELTDLSIEIGQELEREMNEGEHHKGLSAVVQVLARRL